ncbi:transglycosylase domain-containing protein [Streptomyces fragilis]|uniref:Transglycosylase domain-containing protein n=1 Tax=Streptomyces fragilis TaxID=67301 RepID=A0ABV2YHV0_9ACTN|nr:transglycosylase domain-containing protein [Streptomyces fragilis]
MPNKRSGGGLSPVQQAAKFLGISVLAGGVLAGIALPAFGTLGLAAKGSVESFDEIPANLKRPPLSQRTTILDADGGKIATVYFRDRTVVPLKKMSPLLQKAIVAIEDARFYEHGAVDLKGVLRALNSNARSGEVTQGASTLTQQYVKNVFVEEAGDDPDKVAQATQQTLGRKIQELKYAIQVEEELGKKKILENYLNITYFGQSAYGVEAASQRYFSKSAEDLELQEAAMLAGLVQSPTRYDPINNPKTAEERRNVVIDRMAQVGEISRAQADAAKKKPLGLKIREPRNGCITSAKGAGFFCDYVRRVFLDDPAFGKDRETRAKLWAQGGMTIRTTLDPQAQESVQASLKSHVYKDDKVAAAATMVEPGTGKILAMGQSRPYGSDAKRHQTVINYSVDQAMGDSGGFPTGSTFKPFLAAAAIEGGLPLNKVYSSPNKMAYPKVQGCKSSYNQGEMTQNEVESEVGPYSLQEAMKLSINTYFVQMVGDLGLCPTLEMVEKMGVRTGAGKKLPDAQPSVILGTQSISPLTMASAYATFASRGMYCTPIAIESVTQKVGEKKKTLEVPKSTCERAMEERTADAVNTLLSGVTDSGTGARAGLSDRDNAGKTGTTDARKNAWFVGYTPNLSSAVWLGDPMQQEEMTTITIGGTYFDKVSGGAGPGPIWRQAMTGALQGKDAPSFNKVHIPADKPKDKDKGDDKPRDGLFGGMFGGGNATGGNGGTDGGMTTNGGTTTDGGLTLGGLTGGDLTGGATGTDPTTTGGFVRGNDNGGGNGP